MHRDETDHQPFPDRQQPFSPPPERQSPRPGSLPSELADFLRTCDTYACVPHATDRGTVFVVKAPSAELAQLPSRVPIELRHELYAQPTAPVIRTLVQIHDQPDSPLAIETFTNVGDPVQRADFEALTTQEQLHMLFYDEEVTHRRTLTVPISGAKELAQILTHADERLQALPAEQFDFDRAKAEVIAATSLP